MKVLSLEAPRALEDTIHAIQHGGVVAFPTDTVFGLGASLKYPDALDRIYQVKGRETTKPLPVLISSLEKLDLVTPHPGERILALLREFWPGPLTMILPARADLPPQVVATDHTVGVRIPNHSIALTLCDRAGGALAVTSANRSGDAPACSADEIVEQLPDDIDIVLKGGLSPCGEPSTVIRMDNARIATIREGKIPSNVIEEVWARLSGFSSPTQ